MSDAAKKVLSGDDRFRMIRKELIRKLLLSGHLNVPEREFLMDKPLGIGEVRKAIKEELWKSRFFPPIADSWEKNRFYYDGLVIENRYPQFILHEQHSGATLNLMVDNEISFTNVDDVIECYLHSGNLNLDGVKMVE